MRKNYETCLSGDKVVFVPYRPEHVPTYHEWMKDPFLLETTGSEILSYEQEVQMQQTWKDDNDKCTFILLAKELCVGLTDHRHQHIEHGNDCATGSESSFVAKNLDAMIGDINLFLSDGVEDKNVEQYERDSKHSYKGHLHDENHFVDNESNNSKYNYNTKRQAELDIMIAVKEYRGKGIGKESVYIMMHYGAKNLGISRFFVKIKEDNIPSRTLFESALGFIQCNYAKCFREVELEFKRDSVEDMIQDLEALWKKTNLVEWRSFYSMESSVETTFET